MSTSAGDVTADVKTDCIAKLRVAGCVFGYKPPMHEVVVNVVAMAVSTVMTMFKILFQSSFFMVLIF